MPKRHNSRESRQKKSRERATEYYRQREPHRNVVLAQPKNRIVIYRPVDLTSEPGPAPSSAVAEPTSDVALASTNTELTVEESVSPNVVESPSSKVVAPVDTTEPDVLTLHDDEFPSCS